MEDPAKSFISCADHYESILDACSIVCAGVQPLSLSQNTQQYENVDSWTADGKHWQKTAIPYDEYNWQMYMIQLPADPIHDYSFMLPIRLKQIINMTKHGFPYNSSLLWRGSPPKKTWGAQPNMGWGWGRHRINAPPPR